MKRLALGALAVAAALAIHSCGGGDDAVVPEPPATNRAPVAVGSIPAAEIPATDTVTVDLSGYFNDPDGDRLVYSATTSNSSVVTASVDGNVLSLVGGLSKGTATVTVTARDPGGLTATQGIQAMVVGKPGFFTVVLEYPEPDIGAVVLRIVGPSVDSLRAGAEFALYQVPDSGGVHVFVAGQIPASDTILRFWSEDITAAGEYRAVVEQAAGKTYEQRPVESARVEVVR